MLKVFMTDQLRPILSDATKYFHALSMFKPRSANPLNNEMYFVFMNKRICSKKIVNYLNVEESKNYYTSTVKKITNFLSSYTRGEVSSMMGDDEVFNMRKDLCLSEVSTVSEFQTEPGFIEGFMKDLQESECCRVDEGVDHDIGLEDLPSIVQSLSVADTNSLISVCQNIQRDLLNKDRVETYIIDLIELFQDKLSERFMDEYLSYANIKLVIDVILKGVDTKVHVTVIDENSKRESWGTLSVVVRRLKTLQSNRLPESVGSVLQNWNRSSARSKYDPFFEECGDDIAGSFQIIVRNSISL